MLLWSASDTNRHRFHKTNPNTKIFLRFLRRLTPEPVRVPLFSPLITEKGWWREQNSPKAPPGQSHSERDLQYQSTAVFLTNEIRTRKLRTMQSCTARLKAEIREQHPSPSVTRQQHKKWLNYDMPHFFFVFCFCFLPGKACWALVLFAWRVQTLNLCMWYTRCSRKQSQLDASLCNHTHSAVLATLSLLLRATSPVDNEREASAAPHTDPAPLTLGHCDRTKKLPLATSMYTQIIQAGIGCEPACVQTRPFVPTELTRIHQFWCWEITRLPSCLQKASVSLTGHQVGWKLAPLLMAQSDGCGRQFHFCFTCINVKAVTAVHSPAHTPSH